MQVLRISCARVVTRWQNSLSKFELSEGVPRDQSGQPTFHVFYFLFSLKVPVNKKNIHFIKFQNNFLLVSDATQSLLIFSDS